MVLPMSTIHIDSGLHPFPRVVDVSLVYGDRNILESHQHINALKVTEFQGVHRQERKLFGPSCGHFQSTETEDENGV